jgi:uncharacterized protein
VVAVVAVLLATNLLDLRGPLASVPVITHLLAIAALLWLARRDGLTRHDLGIAPGDLRRGAAASAVIVIGVAAVYAAVALLPATRDFLADDKADISGTALLVQVLLRIPVVTVLFEEVAFRGVLWAQGTARLGVVGGTALSSVLFGLWHLLPSLGLAARNDGLGDLAGSSGAVALTVVFTGLAGVVFCELRRRTGSLLTPIALHWSVNAFGLIAAWLVVRG